MANLRLRENRARDALPLIEEATAIDQQNLPPGHPFIGDDLHDLGLVYETLGRKDMARLMLNAALDSLEAGAARDTPRVAYVESDLSRLYRDAGEQNAADAALRDAKRILNKAEAEEHRRERQV
jgi:tetratricopeptide (TPR) repeat protein